MWSKPAARERDKVTMSNGLRLAIPSGGPLHEPSLLFLKLCGVGVLRSNDRRYTAEVPAIPGVTAHFQRHGDILQEIEERSADVGIVGYDGFSEVRRQGGDSAVVIDGLGFGHSQLVLAVPVSWVDVASLADLTDISREFRERGDDLRIATKFPRLVERFLLANGVSYFSLVGASGTLEAAPAMGYADIIADLSSTGTTLRENHLKTIRGGVVISSEACLIANTSEMSSSPEKLAQATALVERIEGHLQSLDYYGVTANMRGEAPEGGRQVRPRPRRHLRPDRSHDIEGLHQRWRGLVRGHRNGPAGQAAGRGREIQAHRRQQRDRDTAELRLPVHLQGCLSSHR